MTTLIKILKALLLYVLLSGVFLGGTCVAQGLSLSDGDWQIVSGIGMGMMLVCGGLSWLVIRSWRKKPAATPPDDPAPPVP